jgi:hypothetical protein
MLWQRLSRTIAELVCGRGLATIEVLPKWKDLGGFTSVKNAIARYDSNRRPGLRALIP